MADHFHSGDRYAVTLLSEDQETLSPALRRPLRNRLPHRRPPRRRDHVLFIGEVEHLDYRDGVSLLFYAGNCRSLHVGLSDDIFFY
ncbi:hypothetical protein [Rhodococcus opacus]|uniref:hypothetical protein n=1 Tax=Rhodococcus opacus TaxID=37919 RepID=UPI001F548478